MITASGVVFIALLLGINNLVILIQRASAFKNQRLLHRAPERPVR